MKKGNAVPLSNRDPLVFIEMGSVSLERGSKMLSIIRLNISASFSKSKHF